MHCIYSSFATENARRIPHTTICGHGYFVRKTKFDNKIIFIKNIYIYGNPDVNIHTNCGKLINYLYFK